MTVEGGTHNILVRCVDVCSPTCLVLFSAILFKWDILCSFLTKNHVVLCVSTTIAKRILFRNHINKKVVGGKHIILVHSMHVCAPDSSGVVLCNPFKWDILWFISGPKSCYLCACHKSEMHFIPQPHEQKSGRRQTQCSSTLCGW